MGDCARRRGGPDLTGRRTLIFGAALILTLGPPALGTASASARPARSHPVSSRSLALHRAEHRWHLQQMDSHRVTFGRVNRSVKRRYPFAAPVTDRAVGVTHVIHRGMGLSNGTSLRFHERFAPR